MKEIAVIIWQFIQAIILFFLGFWSIHYGALTRSYSGPIPNDFLTIVFAVSGLLLAGMGMRSFILHYRILSAWCTAIGKNHEPPGAASSSSNKRQLP